MLLLIAPLFFLAAGLLAISGVGKMVRPRPAAQALYAAGLPGRYAAVRVLGAAEIAAGIAALVRPGPATALAVGLLYAAFAGFLAFLLLARPAATSCGCGGAKDVPPSWLHVAFNLAAVLVAVGVAIVGAPTPGELVRALGLVWLPAAAGLITAGWLVVVVVAEVPIASRSWTAPTHHEQEIFDPDRHRRADVALTSAGVEPGHASLWPDHDPPSLEPTEDADVGR